MGLLGKLLRPVRAGQQHSFWNRSGFRAPETLGLQSSEFDAGGWLLPRHTGTRLGENVSPQLTIDGIPSASSAILLVLEDSDVPLPRPVVHTVALLSPERASAGCLSLDAGGLTGGASGVEFLPASFGRRGYYGPRPIPSHGPHAYEFSAYALSGLAQKDLLGKKLGDLKTLLDGKILARGRLTGHFEQK